MDNSERTHAQFLSPSVVAQALGVHVVTLRRWIAAELVPVHQPAGPGGRLLIPANWLDQVKRQEPGQSTHKQEPVR